ncbi:MAG TPA: HEAT repeat domain-containing protein [Gemmataceae bacterium]|nr:HEAT repeat domain-containing protein [Gemmataceae bacterium]
MPLLTRILLACCLGFGVVAGALAAAQDSRERDEQTLKEAGVAGEGKGLLDFFRKRTLTPEGQKRIEIMVRELGDSRFKIRAKASADLVAEGVVALPFLRQALKERDLEVIHRAEECIRLIEEKEPRVGLAAAALRLVVARKPHGALPVILEYAPFAEDDVVTGEVVNTLIALGVRDGKPDPVLMQALSNAHPLRRSLAAAALCNGGVGRGLSEVKRLLKDADSGVRLRVGLALASAGEKEAVPVLIELLTQLPQGGAWQAEDLLLRLAGEEAPRIDLGRDDAAHRKCRDAWAAWWGEHHARADLSRIEGNGRVLGYTLIVLLDEGRVIELDNHDKTRLEISGLKLPLDAQILPGDRVLIAEHGGDRVTERSPKGEILWEKQIAEPLMAQRLRNGNTFIATPPRLLEVDREGKVVYSYSRPGGENFMKAQKLPNGEIACVTMMHRFVRLDPSGKELQSFTANVNTSGGRIEVLPGNHVLVPERQQNRVVEYNAEGQVVSRLYFREPIAAVRLANGHTLITSYSQNRAVEVDENGREVWEYRRDTKVTRAFRR